MKLEIHNTNGEKTGTLDAAKEWKDIPRAKQAVKDTVVWHLARLRRGTVSTKIRSEVSFSRRKVWKQKGTGRARVGNAANPIWRKGGVVFGPKPRDFSFSLPKKVRQLAFKSVVADKIRNNEIIIIDKININKPKTKTVQLWLNNLNSGRRALVVTEDTNRNLLLSLRNIPGANLIKTSNLDVYTVLNHKKVIVTKKAWALLEERVFGKRKGK